jgi:hypothetical protein
VKKDQPLVVIESMKMETVIRSPMDGVVKKIVHGKGVSDSNLLLEPKSILTNVRCRICAKPAPPLLNLRMPREHHEPLTDSYEYKRKTNVQLFND